MFSLRIWLFSLIIMSSKPSAERATITLMVQPRAHNFMHFPSILGSIFAIISFGFADTGATGPASWYGEDFAGNLTANGEIFDPSELTAAHLTLPFGTLVRVTNDTNGETVVVRINDRGPYIHGRIIDLSHAAADAIGMVRAGVAQVSLEILAEDGSAAAETMLADNDDEDNDDEDIANIDYVDVANSATMDDNASADVASADVATVEEITITTAGVQQIVYHAAHETEESYETVQAAVVVPSIEASLVGMEQRDASLHIAQTVLSSGEDTLEASAQLSATLRGQNLQDGRGQDRNAAYQQAINNKLAARQATHALEESRVEKSMAEVTVAEAVTSSKAQQAASQDYSQGYALLPVETVYEVRQSEPQASAPRVLRRIDRLSTQQATQDVLVAVEHLQPVATRQATATPTAAKQHAIQVVTWLGSLEVVCPEYPEGTTLHVRGTTSSEIIQVQVVKANIPLGSPMLASQYLAATLGDSLTVLN